MRSEEMAKVICAEVALFLSLMFQNGVSPGGEFLSLYYRVEDDVTLPCKNVILTQTNCSSTTWMYQDRPGSTAELVNLGETKKENSKAERLSLGPNCSLNIHNVKLEDVSLYTCRQFPVKDGPQQGRDAAVSLSLLTISSSIPQSELKPGNQVNLTCSLLTRDGPGVCNHNFKLNWVDGTGREIQGDIGHQISQSHGPCQALLTVTPQKDINSPFRCELRETGNLKTFADFTIKLPEEQNILAVSLGGAVGAAVVCLLVVLVIVARKNKSKNNQLPTDDKIVESEDGVTYVAVDLTNKNKPLKDNGQDQDAVIYSQVGNNSEIRRQPEEDPIDISNLYAQVNKHRKS